MIPVGAAERAFSAEVQCLQTQRSCMLLLDSVDTELWSQRPSQTSDVFFHVCGCDRVWTRGNVECTGVYWLVVLGTGKPGSKH